jgi:hypothetical protein
LCRHTSSAALQVIFRGAFSHAHRAREGQDGMPSVRFATEHRSSLQYAKCSRPNPSPSPKSARVCPHLPREREKGRISAQKTAEARAYEAIGRAQAKGAIRRASAAAKAVKFPLGNRTFTDMTTNGTFLVATIHTGRGRAC